MTVETVAMHGTAAGVPYTALPPSGGPRPAAPLVVGWHLMDAPRTETAFASALPLHGLDAWRVYLGLPMHGSRLPAGGPEELMRLAYEDALLNLYRPVVVGAAEEFPAALADVRRQLGIEPGPLALLGASAGAAVAGLVAAEGEQEVAAAVLVSPVVRLRAVVEAMERQFEVAYRWTDESDQLARRLDFVARAPEIAGSRSRPAVLLVVGAEDEPEFREPAARMRDALRRAYGEDERAELVIIPGMGHALAEEPGVEAAPQTPAAAQVDGHAARWLRTWLATR